MEPHSIKFSQQINTLNRRNFKSPESELANESVYVPKDNFNTPVKGKENDQIKSPNFDIPEPIVFQNTYQQPPQVQYQHPPQMQYQHPNMYGQGFNSAPQYLYTQPYYGGEYNPMMYSAKGFHQQNDMQGYFQNQIPQLQYGYHVCDATQRNSYLENLISQLNQVIIELKNENKYIKEEVDSNRAQILQYEIASNQSKNQDQSKMINLQKSNAYLKKVIGELEEDNLNYKTQVDTLLEQIEIMKDNEQRMISNHFDEIKNLKRDHEYQIKKLNDTRRESEDVDPYINLNIKKERMPYHQKNMYIPLSTYSNVNQSKVIDARSTMEESLQFSPSRNERTAEKSFSQSFQQKNNNLRSSVGECLSWRENNNEENENLSTSANKRKLRENASVEPKRLFTQSFAEKPPMKPIDKNHFSKTNKNKVQFWDEPPAISQPSQRENPSKRSSSHSGCTPVPVFALHNMKPTSLVLPSEEMSGEERIEVFNIERNISQLKQEQYKKQEEYDKISDYSKSNWERRRKKQLEVDLRSLQSSLQFLNRKLSILTKKKLNN